MALVKNEVNPLSVLNFRKLEFMPRHFATMKLQISSQQTLIDIDLWIKYNLNSRYAIIHTVSLDQNNKPCEFWEVGLESPKELSLFALGCPHLYKK
jgi:hypothetical protein